MQELDRELPEDPEADDGDRLAERRLNAADALERDRADAALDATFAGPRPAVLDYF